VRRRRVQIGILSRRRLPPNGRVRATTDGRRTTTDPPHAPRRLGGHRGHLGQAERKIKVSPSASRHGACMHEGVLCAPRPGIAAPKARGAAILPPHGDTDAQRPRARTDRSSGRRRARPLRRLSRGVGAGLRPAPTIATRSRCALDHAQHGGRFWSSRWIFSSPLLLHRSRQCPRVRRDPRRHGGPGAAHAQRTAAWPSVPRAHRSDADRARPTLNPAVPAIASLGGEPLRDCPQPPAPQRPTHRADANPGQRWVRRAPTGRRSYGSRRG
jgi:hypothetical protein